jgi:hypothetical protein
MSCCRVVVRESPRRVTVRQDVRAVRVASPGPQGPQGPPGDTFTGAYAESVNGRSGQVTLGVSDVRNVTAARLLGRRVLRAAEEPPRAEVVHKLLPQHAPRLHEEAPVDRLV